MTTAAIKSTSALRGNKLYNVWLTLRITFGIVPIVAGLDKFANILTDWTQYLNADMISHLPVTSATFMMMVGVIEIIAGIVVFVKTELGAYIVAAWLTCIALSLLVSFSYVDVAVRDLVMAVAAFSLGKLTDIRQRGN